MILLREGAGGAFSADAQALPAAWGLFEQWKEAIVFGAPELAIIIVIILLIFGPALIPKLARQVGELWRSTRELKDSLPNADDFKDDKPAKPKKSE